MNLRLGLLLFLLPVFLGLIFAVYYRESKKAEIERFVDSGVVELCDDGMVTREDLRNYIMQPPTGDSSILRGLEMTAEDVEGLETEDPEWFEEPGGQMLLNRIIKHITLIKLLNLKQDDELQKQLSREVKKYRESLMINAMENELDQIKPTVTQEEMMAYYVDNADQFHRKGLRFARHIMLDKNASPDPDDPFQITPDVIKNRLLNGVDFQRLIMYSKSESINNDGYLGWLPKGSLADPFEDALWSLEIGEITGPVEVGDHVHFIQLLDAQPEGLVPFEESIPQIRETLQEQKRILHRFKLLGLPADTLTSSDVEENDNYKQALLDAAYARGWDNNIEIVEKTNAFKKFRKADLYFSHYAQELKNTIAYSESPDSSVFIENEAVNRLLEECDYQLLIKLNLPDQSKVEN